MAFLKCVSAYGAEGCPGQYLERNLLCETIDDANELFGDDNTLVTSDLDGVCPSVCIGDVFNVFVSRDNDTFRSEDNKFRPELVDNWEATNLRLTCVYVKRDEYSDKLDYALFIPHAKSKIIQPIIAPTGKAGHLPYNNSLFTGVYAVNVGGRTGGGDRISINNEVSNFNNLDPFKYIFRGVKQTADKDLTVVKSNDDGDVLFCAVADTCSTDAPVVGDVVTYDIRGDIQQPDSFITILPFNFQPKGVRVDIYPYDESKVFNEKPVFKLTLTDDDKTVIGDNILAGVLTPIDTDVGAHKIVFLMKTAYGEALLATVRVSLFA